MALCAGMVVVVSVVAMDNSPQNVKLALGGADSMLVTWKTATAVNDSRVLFGSSSSALTGSAAATVFTLYAPDGFYYRAKIGPLLPNTRYYYQVGSAQDAISPVLSFRSQQTPKDTVRALVVGDMGLSVCCSKTTQPPV